VLQSVKVSLESLKHLQGISKTTTFAVAKSKERRYKDDTVKTILSFGKYQSRDWSAPKTNRSVPIVQLVSTKHIIGQYQMGHWLLPIQ
jgi:hypothetical protein